MNNLEAIAQLKSGLEACAVTNALHRSTEASFIFELTEDEYATFDAPERVNVDSVDGSTSRTKIIFDAEEFFDLSIMVGAPEQPSSATHRS